MRVAILIAACAALALPACGGDDDESERAATSTAPAGTSTTETQAPADAGSAPGELSEDDEEEIRGIVMAAATNREPCEHLTERYKREFVFEGVSSSDPGRACEQAEHGQPELRDSDVDVTDVSGTGDRAEVKFTIAGVDQSAEVVREGDRWLIDKFDF